MTQALNLLYIVLGVAVWVVLTSLAQAAGAPFPLWVNLPSSFLVGAFVIAPTARKLSGIR